MKTTKQLQRKFKIAIFFILVLFVLALTMLIKTYSRGQKDREAFLMLQEAVKVGEEKSEGEGSLLLKKYEKLHQENPDFFGWIELKNTPLNYPVVYTPEDPEHYLRRDFEGNYSISGVPFVGKDYLKEGKHTIVYGHNMTNGTMFSPLFKYKDQKYWQENSRISFDTLLERGEYEVFAVCRTDVQEAEKDFPFHEYTDLRNEETFREYVDLCRKNALYDTEIDVSPGDTLLTLSTCSYHAIDGRYVVIAKKIDGTEK